ncbi:MAG: DUF3795 domain-containing protein [Candidatus Thermoplasmatota archaeon]
MKRRERPREAEGAEFVGCCGAYCRTCRSFVLGDCKGCRLGYDEGERDISRARCRVKVCCIRDKGLGTCADCPEFDRCGTLAAFHGKKWKEYGRYRESLEFIRREGYPAFIETSKGWERGYGDLGPPRRKRA